MSVYIIRSKDLSLKEFYIGSCEDMGKREQHHKSRCNNENSPKYYYKVYQHIRANGGWDAWQMVEIACVWHKSTKPLFQIEQDYIDSYKSTLNSYRAYTSKEQRKEQKNKNARKYREKNRKMINGRMKEYYQKNRDVRIDRAKEYYENNKEDILEKAKEKFICECGGKYTYKNKTKHINTNKHKSFVENKE